MIAGPDPTAAAGLTPLRALDPPREQGVGVLREGPFGWLDGGEAGIAEILRSAADLSSTSDELAAQARGTWIERYHLAPERGNIVRGLELEGLRVLEVGAGCGAITRALGERAALVDAVEPNPERARVAALRVADLGTSRVFAGLLEDVPATPAYDLVVVVGVLEYVGGSAGEEDRVAFLREAAARLRPGGAVALAIENRLGVKYLAGAPEDHAGRPFEGLERYPHEGPARTFARGELERLLGRAGLESQVLHVLPDYKHPRLVFADALLAGPAAPLAWRVPRFPSPPAPLPAPRLASEGPLWRGLVEAGLGGECANSFLVLAGRPGFRSPWREDQRAVFWSSGRRACFSTRTEVVERADGLHALRTHVVPGPAERRVGELEHRVVAEAPFVAGTPLSEVLATAPAQAVPGLLRTWREHVEIGASAGGPIALDPAPGNVLRDAAGGLVDVDEEWFHHAAGVREVLERSLLHEAMALADARPPETWPDLVTVGDLLRRLAGEAGLGPVDEEALARREGAFQAEVGGVDAEAVRAGVHAMLERPLRLGPLGIREHELRAELERRLIAQDTRVQELHDAAHERLLALEEAAAERTALEAELAELRAAHAQVVGSRSWRATEGLRRFAARLRR